jgi:signal-transduction protein with cAMP-binding, CBS, and nucleotidyltransferase domain
MKEILNYLSQTYWKLTEEVMTYVLQKCDELSISEGEVISEEGKVCRHVWFIKKGLLAAFQQDPGDPIKKHCNWFMKESDIATSVLSFFLELPSEEKIVAQEDTIVFRMSKKDLFAGMERFPSMSMLTTLIIIKYYCECKFNETYLRMKQPQFIFQHLLSGNNEVLQRALQADIATYLGVSEPVYRDIKSGKYKQKQDKEKPAKLGKSKKK